MRKESSVQRVLRRLEETRWKYYNLHPDTAAVLTVLARIGGARSVVEVGTANGYSAIALGEAVRAEGGRVTTIERDGELVEEARKNIAAAGLDEVVTVIPGSAYKVLRQELGPWDFVFLDGTKQEYVGYLERVLPKLAPRAMLTADNVLSHADELQAFQKLVAADPRINATTLPVGTGLLIGLFEDVRASPAVSADVMLSTACGQFSPPPLRVRVPAYRSAESEAVRDSARGPVRRP